jgi:hypothetical protein
MESNAKLIKKTILSQPENKLFNASFLYHQYFPNLLESTYYKVIERMKKRGELMTLGKGMFIIPTKHQFSQPLSEDLTLKLLLNRRAHLEIGYALFNRLGLSSQISKNRYFYVNKLNNPVQKVNQFTFIKKNINFQNVEIKNAIELLEVLQNYQHTQDLSLPGLHQYLKDTLHKVNLESIENVLSKMKYKKRTIAFLNHLLENHRGLKNPLGSHLCQVSKYNIPNLGGPFESKITH